MVFLLRRGLRILVLITLFASQLGWARVESLRERPLPSPNGRMAANVEWESLGVVGLLRMRLYSPSGTPIASVEVPEISPNPDELHWLDDDWVMCESFLGEHAVGFFYVHARQRRGYLLEILQPNRGSDWNFTVSYSEPGSTMTVSCVGRARSMLFPVLLRDCPKSENEYFSLEFCRNFADEVDGFVSWKKTQRIREFELIGEAALAEGKGGLIVARLDGRHAVLYFPLSATSTKEMLARVRRLDVFTTQSQALLTSTCLFEMSPRWLEGTRFVVECTSSRVGASRSKPARIQLAIGEVPEAVDGAIRISTDTEVVRGRSTLVSPSEPADTEDSELLDDAVDLARQTGTTTPPAILEYPSVPSSTKKKSKRN
ncbi:hypothetical protein BRCON_1356 [Candidatus Sumerlaea chitinivorans]|uniref:Uncharacterized protein n=1 Tax=Sumerlaea chitinivorans TaxID=2250252 RepID=A0A2Z4Y6J3_SUMC1|nr:hypothetical protein BRCON_1356 [Candidatus Sumerlaea chitinivorans]